MVKVVYTGEWRRQNFMDSWRHFFNIISVNLTTPVVSTSIFSNDILLTYYIGFNLVYQINSIFNIILSVVMSRFHFIFFSDVEYVINSGTCKLNDAVEWIILWYNVTHTGCFQIWPGILIMLCQIVSTFSYWANSSTYLPCPCRILRMGPQPLEI